MVYPYRKELFVTFSAALLSVCPGFFAYLYILLLTQRRATLRRSLLTAAIFLVATITLHLIACHLFRLSGILIYLADMIFCIGLAYTLSQYRDSRALFVGLTALLFVTTAGSMGDSLLYFSDSPLGRVPFVLTFHFLFLFFIYACFRHVLQDMFAHVGSRWRGLCVIPLTMIVCFFLVDCLTVTDQDSCQPEHAWMVIFLCMAAVQLYGMVVYLFYRLRRQAQLENQGNVMKLQMRVLESHTAYIETNLNRARRFRHDLRHHFCILASCLDSGNLDAARQVLAAMDINFLESYPPSPLLAYTGDLCMDAVISHFDFQAKKANVALLVDMTLPKTLPVDQTELAVVLANALENALNATRKVPLEDRKSVV